MSVNKVILVGHLGSDPEVKYLNENRVVANVNLATNETYKDKEGNKVTQTEWHKLEMWDGLARIAEQYLKKGKEIYVEGRIKTETWKDKDDNTRYTTRIRVTDFKMLGAVQDKKDQTPHSESNIETHSNTSVEGTNYQNADDLPF
jgi:single-strand DNA-binding protein